MIGGMFGGNIGITAVVFLFLLLIGLILGTQFKYIFLKHILIIIIALMLCSIGVMDWSLVVGSISTLMLILISLLLTALPFTVGFIIGIILSRKKRR